MMLKKINPLCSHASKYSICLPENNLSDKWKYESFIPEPVPYADFTPNDHKKK